MGILFCAYNMNFGDIPEKCIQIVNTNDNGNLWIEYIKLSFQNIKMCHFIFEFFSTWLLRDQFFYLGFQISLRFSYFDFRRNSEYTCNLLRFDVLEFRSSVDYNTWS